MEEEEEDRLWDEEGDMGVALARVGRGGGGEEGAAAGMRTSGMFSSAKVRISLISFGFALSSFSEMLWICNNLVHSLGKP